jgi:hypothetical protein
MRLGRMGAAAPLFFTTARPFMEEGRRSGEGKGKRRRSASAGRACSGSPGGRKAWSGPGDWSGVEGATATGRAARRGDETKRNETEWSERAPDGGRRGAGGLGGCTARTGAECRLQTEAFFGQGPAATTECILDASVRPCLVPKNFTKFFRFSVTSNL